MAKTTITNTLNSLLLHLKFHPVPFYGNLFVAARKIVDYLCPIHFANNKKKRTFRTSINIKTITTSTNK